MSAPLVLVFPGQGSQYVGMVKGDTLTKWFDQADAILGTSLRELAQDGPLEELSLTENTQPALLTHSVACFEQLQKHLQRWGIRPSVVLGHSVGEYAALVAARALTFEQALKAVRVRAQAMQSAVPVGKGKMVAILRAQERVVRQACEEVSTVDAKVMPANYNGADQIVISGHASACDKAVAYIQEHSKARAIPLKVSAPFHSSLMAPAARELEEYLATVSFAPLQTPYIANVNAHEYGPTTAPKTLRQNLVHQVCGSVLWHQSMEQLPENAVVVEVGPGKVLSTLAQKMGKFKVITLDQDESWGQLEEALR